MADTTLETIIKVEHRRGAEKIHLQYLKYLYNAIEIVEDTGMLPKTADFISCTSGDELNVILNMFAGMLTHNNLIAIKMYQTKVLLVVEVSNA